MTRRPVSMRTIRIPSMALYLVLTAGGVRTAAQQVGVVRHNPADYVAVATRLMRPPVIDGRLEDDVWGGLPRIRGFVQLEPEEGERATEGTEVRIAYTRTDLYFAFRCFDQEPEELRVLELRRDSEMEGDDRVEIILDTFHDHRNAYAFRFNAAGAMWDAQVREEGASINVSWDGVWWVRTRVEDWGWAAEVRIPFSTFRFPEGGEQSWGMNIQRVIRRKNEDTYWAPVWRGMEGPGIEGKYRIAFAGTLEGMRGVRQGTRWELKPYFLNGALKAAGKNVDEDTKVGVDLRYSLAANMVADLTLNTDFAQVEADQEQINLDRFPLFFPEKREFFLEGLDIFTFGMTEPNAPPPFQLFYSRRIGLSQAPNGDHFEVPLMGGLKVTGKAGPYAIGALAVRSRKASYEWSSDPAVERASVPAAWQGVFRISRDIMGRSRVGAMWLGTDAGLTGSGYEAGGLDAAFSFFRNTQIYTFLAGARRGPGDFAPAGAFNYYWNTDRWGVAFTNLYIDSDWNDDLGFVHRRGSWRNKLDLSFGHRPGMRGVRKVTWFFDTTYHTKWKGHLESRLMNPGGMVELQNGGLIVGGVNVRYEALDYNFNVGDVAMPAGVHRWQEAFAMFASDPSRTFGTETTVIGGGFYHGERVGLLSTLRWTPSRHWTAQLVLQSNHIRDETDTFRGTVAATRIIWTPVTDVVAKLFAQVNTAGDEGNINLLIAWRHRPRSYFYLVFNDSYEKRGGAWRSGDRAFYLKGNILITR